MKTKAILVSLLFFGTLFTGAALASAGELGGTTWSVTAISNGKQAVQSIVACTEITVYFKTDGTLVGSAGCNRYIASYTVSGKKIRIEPAASTRMMCADPPGIMEQERLYLDTLKNVRSYRMANGRLDLLNADGFIAVTMVAASTENSRFLLGGEATEVLAETMPNGKMIMTYHGDEYILQRVGTHDAAYVDTSDKTTTFLVRGNNVLVTIKGKKLPALTLISSANSYGLLQSNKEVYGDGAMEVIIERISCNILLMTVNGETFRMKLTGSANGRRYASDSDPGTIFWLYGDNATLTLKGKTYPGQILKRLYEKDEITQKIESNNQMLIGKWQVESVAGRNVLPGTMITMAFSEDGRIAGKATINNYFAMWLAVDDAIVFTGAGSTMMMGPEEQMRQEQSFLDTLRKVSKYDIRENKLIMTTADGAQIVSAKKK